MLIKPSIRHFFNLKIINDLLSKPFKKGMKRALIFHNCCKMTILLWKTNCIWVYILILYPPDFSGNQGNFPEAENCDGSSDWEILFYLDSIINNLLTKPLKTAEFPILSIFLDSVTPLLAINDYLSTDLVDSSLIQLCHVT